MLEDHPVYGVFYHLIEKLKEQDAWSEIGMPGYRREDWRQEVSEEATQLGYWEWVVHRYEFGGK